MQKDAVPEIIDALTRLLNVLFSQLGTGGTVALLIILFLAIVGYRVYTDRRKDKDVDLALKEKDKTIQRLAEQERNYRILFFKEKAGWTDDEIDRFFLKNEPENPTQARRLLETEPEQPKKASKKKRGGQP